MIRDAAPGILERLVALGLPYDSLAYVVPPLAIAIGFAAGALLEHGVLRLLHAVAVKSGTRLDDVVTGAVRGPVKVFLTLLAGAAGFVLAPGPEWIRGFAESLLVLLAAAGLVVMGARFVGGLIVAYGDRAHLTGSSGRAVRRVTSIAIYLVGILLFLDNQGVSITPLLTTMGLAGLAVALAFQDTLSNFFAGLYVQADRPLDVGHYVRLEDLAIEGFVVEVGWRTTKIRTLPNNIVVVPNARVAQAVVTDYDLPEPRMSLLIRVPVARDADPRRVEAILLEEAVEADIPGLRREPAPFVRFIPGFTEQGMEFTLIAQVDRFVDQYAVQHELRHRILARLRREGIGLGYPVRIVTPEGPRPLVTEAPRLDPSR